MTEQSYNTYMSLIIIIFIIITADPYFYIFYYDMKYMAWCMAQTCKNASIAILK